MDVRALKGNRLLGQISYVSYVSQSKHSQSTGAAMTDFEKARDEARMKKEYLVIAQVQEFDAGAGWAYEWFHNDWIKVDIECIKLRHQNEQLTKEAAELKEKLAVASESLTYERRERYKSDKKLLEKLATAKTALESASRYTWIGEKGQPGSCYFCGEHRSFHREGTIECIQAKINEGE